MAAVQQQGAGGLDCIVAVRNYIDRIVSSLGEGMKVLLLDADTVQVVSMVYSQSAILEKEVYLVERLGGDEQSSHEPMMHLRAVCFLRPTEENCALLCKELAAPKYAEYHLFFSNVVPPNLLRSVAEADEHDSVRQVQEYFGDYMAINPELFTLNQPLPLTLSAAPRGDVNGASLKRTVSGLLSVLLSFKKKPAQIRYTASSQPAKQVAQSVAEALSKDQIFDFRRSEGPCLLILDRRDDPASPLLSQWTYQAMVHELLGLANNRVQLKGAPNITKDLEEVVLSVTQDSFFAKQRQANFGDLGVAVKGLLDDYQAQAKLNENIQSIDDMHKFLDRYPAFKSHSLNVSKHVAIMSELSRLSTQQSLMDVSALEQELVCDDDLTAHFKALCERIGDAKVANGNKLRLAMLYALRYEERPEFANHMTQIKAGLSRFGVPRADIGLIDSLLAYAGHTKRAPGLYGSLSERLKKKMAVTLQGIANVYTRHEPACMAPIDAALKGRLKDSAYPLIGTSQAPSSSSSSAKASDVIVFIVGGATFEEATKIAELNALSGPNGPKVVLGAPAVHNSTSFLEELRRTFPPAL